MEGILIPQQVFIGDTAEFLFPIDILADFKSPVLTSGNFQIGKIKQNGLMQITDIRITQQEKKDYISITFIPWETGYISFPSLREAGIYDELPQVYISSILETMQTDILQPPRPPVLIPGTVNLLYTAGAATIVGIGIFIFIINAVRKRFFTDSFFHTQKKRVRILYKQLKRLEKKSKTKPIQKKSGEEVVLFGKNWLKEFENAVRIYCFNITNTAYTKNADAFNAFTYSEILFELKNKFKNSYGIYFEFEKIFLRLQELRFDNFLLSEVNIEKECINFLSRIFNLVKITEIEIRKIETVKQDKKKVSYAQF